MYGPIMAALCVVYAYVLLYTQERSTSLTTVVETRTMLSFLIPLFLFDSCCVCLLAINDEIRTLGRADATVRKSLVHSPPLLIRPADDVEVLLLPLLPTNPDSE